MKSFRYFCIFALQNVLIFFVSLYKGLSEYLPGLLTWETLSACLIVLDCL